MMSFAQWGNALYSGKKSYRIVANRKAFLGVSGIVLLLALIFTAVLGIKGSIEFTGGSQFTLTGVADISQQKAYTALEATGHDSNARVSSVGSDGIRVQTDSLDSVQTAAVRDALAQAYGIESSEVQSSSIGPSWGHDVTAKALKSLVIFLALVALLMAVYFRSWTMSLSAIVALLHDVVLTIAFFAVVRVEVSPATVIGFLTILGYSLYDTVVVFDKVRELTQGLTDQKRFTFAELVNLAVNQTMVRSINTSVVALLPVGSILLIGSLLLGAGTLTDISLALFVGMIAGTYSSIFIASPLLVTFEERRTRTKEHTAVVEKERVRHAQGEEGTESDPSVRVAPLQPGHHLGRSAQPQRKKRKR
ncbi:protein translocase subunit SecF [Schaalia sp. lx-260]|uniref:protein translocase subunit SecF n=1 Tax=Schaalia sp. lx-260 TaxID=2899082 RepID=UPI001E417FCA|nr:protein translocase subunit SecF [Schaalia sp. lx-260]MCD4550194.1 protein translocase subunit SecF [Schaalia sp. lx-260]